MTGWTVIAAETVEPLRVVLGAAAAAVAAVGAARVIARVSGRLHHLHTQVLVLVLAALGVAGVLAAVLAWLMVLDGGQLAVVGGVLGLAALLAVAMVVVATRPLGRDVDALEAAVRRIEAGDRSSPAGIDRDDELGHVGRAIDELTGRLAELERERAELEAERSAMLSSVSHDLRTPLAALRLAVEALVDGVAPEPQRYYRAMRRDVDALSALVDDLFLLVRLDHGRFELDPAPVDLTEVADEAIEALAPVAVERGVGLELAAEGRVRVQGNATALGRVIRNLIDNALRYAPEGSTVCVSVADRGAPQVRIVDEGPGFPPEFAESAFEQFTRADASRTRDTGGAGLGLAVARGLVQAHGGRIWIDEPPGGRVAFELPATTARSPASEV